tara:strand:- start:2137 stop:3852 length:1716 start_codon:yes stop_codon:yes gene_type:complete
MMNSDMYDKTLVADHLASIQITRSQSRTTCPVCGPDRKKQGERTLSVKLSDDAAVFLCHHCNIAGAIPLQEEDVANTNSEVVPERVSNLTKDQYSWLDTRGISQDAADRCPLKSGNVYIRSKSKEVECVGFEYQNADKSEATKWRDAEKNFSQTGSAKALWRINDWTGGDLIICEGEMDVLSFEQIGIFATSVPNGAPSTLSKGDNNAKYSYLWDAKDQIESAGRIVLATDSDEPGRLLSEEIARRIGKARCWQIKYPEDCKDANDVLQKHGEVFLKEVLQNATPWPVSGLRDVSEFREDVLSIHANGIDHGAKSGVMEVDKLFRTCPQTLTICTGVPGSGKSSFLSWLVVQLAARNGWSTAVLSAETPSSILLLQLSAIYKQQPFLGSSKMSEEELSASLDWLSQKLVILDESDTSISSVIERAQAAVLRMGVRVLIVDPFNFITGSVGKAEEYSLANINEVLVSLKNLAASHSIAIFLVAHPTKMYRQSDGKVPVPTGYDVSGSSAFYNIADAGITLSRDGNNALFTVWKARFPWIGSVGRTELSFDADTGTFGSALPSFGDVDVLADL